MSAFWQPRLSHWLIALVLAVAAHAQIVQWWAAAVTGAAGRTDTAGEGKPGIELTLALVAEPAASGSEAPAEPAPLNDAAAVAEHAPESDSQPDASPPAAAQSAPEVSPPPLAVAEPAAKQQTSKPVPTKPKISKPKATKTPSVNRKASIQPKTPARESSPNNSARSNTVTDPAAKLGKSDTADPGMRQTAAPATPGKATATEAATKRDYIGQLSAWINRHKHYPRPAQRRRQEGTVRVQFALDRGGRLLAADIVGSSGYPLLDWAALEMIRKAAPLPPIPAEIAQSRLEVVLPVAFNLR